MTSNLPAKPSPNTQANVPTPTGVKVERQPSGHVNSRNEAGGEVERSQYNK